MMRTLLCLFIGCVLLTASAQAETVGIVMLHGKRAMPTQLQKLADTIADAGFVVEQPEMCWSAERIYDLTYLACFADIDRATARLKERGADAIVVLGMSLGANAALGFGARRPGLKGVITLAPAHAPELLRRRPEIVESVARAESATAAGRGEEKTTFDDFNLGKMFTVSTTPEIYLSFFGPNSPAVMPNNAGRLTAPLLVVSGTDDPTQRNAGRIFARTPADPRNKHATVEADHRGTPAASIAIVAAWLRALTD